MLLTPHILTGVAIMAKVQNPILGLLLVFLSHYFLDCFPQEEYEIENIKKGCWHKSFWEFFKVFLDIAFGFLVILLLTEVNILIFIAAFLAILPDGFTLLFVIFSNNKLLKIHNAFHQKINYFFKDKKISPFWGILSQVAVIAVAIFLLL